MELQTKYFVLKLDETIVAKALVEKLLEYSGEVISGKLLAECILEARAGHLAIT